MGFVVAVDGTAGSGKGTVTKIVAEKLNLETIDTGAMYRCVTLAMLEQKLGLNDIDRIEKILQNIKIEFVEDGDNKKVLLNGRDVTLKIRIKEVNDLVSQVSHIIIVRENITDRLRKMAEGKEIIMEGRDIGTNVFPNADVKIYLDATPEERAMRRLKQNQENGINISYEEILKNIIFRDNNDKNSKVAPLKKAPDAVYIDSTGMSVEEEAEEVMKIIQEKRK